MRGMLTLLYPSTSDYRLSQVKSHSPPNMGTYFPQRLPGHYFPRQHHLLFPTFPVIPQPNLMPRSIQLYGHTNVDVLICTRLWVDSLNKTRLPILKFTPQPGSRKERSWVSLPQNDHVNFLHPPLGLLIYGHTVTYVTSPTKGVLTNKDMTLL